MQKTILALFLIFSLLPLSTSFAQIADKEPTLGITLVNNQLFSYKDNEGRTVVLGEIRNTLDSSIIEVKIKVDFYNDLDELLDSVTGSPTLDIIPSQANSPFQIISNSVNSGITNTKIQILGDFDTSVPKQESLVLEPGKLSIGNEINFSGKINNGGELESSNTKIHLILYDSFIPPRIVGLETISINDNLLPGTEESFEFIIPNNSRAFSYKIIAESNNYLSSLVDIEDILLTTLTKLVTIDDISLIDVTANKLPLSEIFVGTEVFIQSRVWIQYSADQQRSDQPYNYYVQIKQTTSQTGKTPVIEFVDKVASNFKSPERQFPTIDWIPEHDGLYFIETYLWDDKNSAISSPGPIFIVHVKP